MQKSDQSAIFNFFHDGTFLSFRREAEDINFCIEIRYLAAMVNPAYTYFIVSFRNCRQFLLQLWGEEKKYYKDIGLISTFLMNMEISSSTFENTQIVVHCLSEVGDYAGSSLIFSCENIFLFDEGQREVTLSDLQEISYCYWNP